MNTNQVMTKLFIVNFDNQETLIKAAWSVEAVTKVMHLQNYEVNKRTSIDPDGWTIVDTVKGTAYAKPLENIEGLIEKYQKTAQPKQLVSQQPPVNWQPYRVLAQAYYGERCVYADYYRTRAKTQKGLHRTMTQIEDNFKHILDLYGYGAWTRLGFTVEYK